MNEILKFKRYFLVVDRDKPLRISEHLYLLFFTVIICVVPELTFTHALTNRDWRFHNLKNLHIYEIPFAQVEFKINLN